MGVIIRHETMTKFFGQTKYTLKIIVHTTHTHKAEKKEEVISLRKTILVYTRN